VLPEDFELRTRYGFGQDWPISYDDLEPFYCDAEDLMSVGGDSERSPSYRSRPYPQRAHALTDPDRAFMAADPANWFPHPCARTPDPVPGQRGACCNNGVCHLCPVDAKFTIMNGMPSLYARKDVDVALGARVTRLETRGPAVSAVIYEQGGEVKRARSDLVVLGANALFNPHILMRSGVTHPELGRGLCEQCSLPVMVELDGLENFQGGTMSTALGYTVYSGDRRRDRAGALIQTINTPKLLNIRGRWREQLQLNFIFEDERQAGNHVRPYEGDPSKPATVFRRKSERTYRGFELIDEDLEVVLAALPVRGYTIGEPWRTDAHIMCTTVMGEDAETSVVDAGCVHHALRNLVVLGSGNFPTAAPPNPTLTIAALSLYAADRLLGRRAPRRDRAGPLEATR
jgi:choline dehydrogenase-like flavoprotein